MLGYNSLLNLVLPSAWDTAEISRLTLRDGTTYEQVIRDINDAIGLFNTDIVSGYLAGMLSLTTEAIVEYRNGAGNSFEDATEWAQPDVQRADTTGHMLPLRHFDCKLGWTSRFLEEARRIQLDADIAAMFDAARNVWEQRVLTRFFKMEEESGRAYGLGASGVSVPFCDGGNGSIPFTPPPRFDRATAFTPSHDHYLRLNGITQANLEMAVKHLWEHGHDQPYELLIAQSDIGSWTNTANVTGYKPRGDVLVMYGQDVSLGAVNDEYVGVITTQYGTCRVKASARIPSGYWGVYKSYGPNDPRNPLRVRYHDTRGFGLKLVVERLELYPLSGAIPQFVFGVGVGEDRTNGVLVRNDTTGDYVTPTIS